MLDWVPVWVWILILAAIVPIEISRIRRARRDRVYAAERARRTFSYAGFRAASLAIVMGALGFWSLVTANWHGALVCLLFACVGSLFFLVLKRRAGEARARIFRR